MVSVALADVPSDETIAFVLRTIDRLEHLPGDKGLSSLHADYLRMVIHLGILPDRTLRLRWSDFTVEGGRLAFTYQISQINDRVRRNWERGDVMLDDDSFDGVAGFFATALIGSEAQEVILRRGYEAYASISAGVDHSGYVFASTRHPSLPMSRPKRAWARLFRRLAKSGLTTLQPHHLSSWRYRQIAERTDIALSLEALPYVRPSHDDSPIEMSLSEQGHSAWRAFARF